MKMLRENFEQVLALAIRMQEQNEQNFLFGESAFLAGLKKILNESRCGAKIEIVTSSEH